MSILSPQPNIKTHTSTPDPTSLPNLHSIPRPNSSILPTTEPPELLSLPTTTTLPSASLFTFLPELYLIISRLAELRTPPALPDLNGNPQTLPLTQTQTQNTINADLTLSLSNESNATGSTNSGSSHLTPLAIRDLPAHIFPVKKAIAAAREVVRALPDVERGVDEQEAELEVLRREVRGLRGRMAELGGIAIKGRERVGGNDGDVVMQGTG